MPYIIDGHNLIPKIPGLSLRSIEDENELIQQLQEYCRLSGKKVEVFFDKAPPGFSGRLSHGRVTAYFVREGSSADAAIHRRLQQQEKGARNWTVVSSDREIQHAAKSLGAQTLSSEEFARILSQPAQAADVEAFADIELSKEEIERWIDEFGAGDEGG
jgi:predicted RNA-binding protein with PIN domain